MKHVLFLCLFAATTAQAQTHLLGVKGGFTATSALASFYSGSDVAESRKGFTAGLTYEHITKGGFSLLVDLLYSQRGYKNDFPVYMVLPDYREPTLQSAYSVLTPYTYVTLPLRMGFNHGNTLYGLANAGIAPALLLQSEEPYFVHDLTGQLTEQGTLDVTAKRNRFDIAVIAEVGGGYKFQNGSRVFASVSVQQSAYDASGGIGYGRIKHRGFALTCGFKWAIPKRSTASTTPAVEE